MKFLRLQPKPKGSSSMNTKKVNTSRAHPQIRLRTN